MKISVNLKCILLVLATLISNRVYCHRQVRSKQGDYDKIPFPHLMYMAPREPGSYTINEKNSFTQELNTGWVLKENEKVDFLFYLFVKERISNLNEIDSSYIYFTLHQNVCNETNLEVYDPTKKFSEDTTYTFKVDFLTERSKIYQQNRNSMQRRRIKGVRRMPRDVNAQDNSTDNGLLYGNNTMLVGNAMIRLKHGSPKYYACVHFATKKTQQNSNETNYVHQGDRNVWCNVVTQQDLLPIWAVVILYLVLLMFSSLCSGLNLGLMSLDLTELTILKKIGSTSEKSYAKKIYPLRAKGNLLLCSILLGNVLVNTVSTLILGNYLDGLFAAIGSTMFIVIFGEIIPQAVCSRYGLQVGAVTRYVMYGIMGCVFIVAYPMSKILNLVLGKEIATVYTRDKIREVMRRAKDGKEMEENQFKLISGALDFKSKQVSSIMVPIKDVFSLDINTILDFDTFKTILYHGYSRIPVYEFTKENLVGVILIQDLLLNDPQDRVPLRAVLDYFKHPLIKCKMDDNLEMMFDKFRKGSHMAFVYKSDDGEVYMGEKIDESVGILTMEDIIEELVQSDIMDEADTKRERRRKRAKEFLSGKLVSQKEEDQKSNENLNIFVNEQVDEHRQSDKPLISSQIRKALFHFLSSSVKPFTAEFINSRLLETFLRKPELIKEKRNLADEDNDNDQNMYLYKYGKECEHFVIILDGKAVLKVGKEGMEVDAGLFSYYGVDALMDANHADPVKCLAAKPKPYKPEFSLKVNSYCVYMKITRSQWVEAVKQSQIERNVGVVSTSGSNEPLSNIGSNTSIAAAKKLSSDSQNLYPNL